MSQFLGDGSARHSAASNGYIPDTKLSDVEHWLEEKPARPVKFPINNNPTTSPKLPNSAKPTSLRRPDKSKQSLPLTPIQHNAMPHQQGAAAAAASPQSNVAINIIRQRSKTAAEVNIEQIP